VQALELAPTGPFAEPRPMLEYNVDFLFASRHNRYRVAVATGATCDTADKVLASIELGGCFDEIVSGYEVPCNKPAPDVYLLAAERLGLEPHECLAIEDSRARPFVAGAEEERGGQCKSERSEVEHAATKGFHEQAHHG